MKCVGIWKSNLHFPVCATNIAVKNNVAQNTTPSTFNK